MAELNPGARRQPPLQPELVGYINQVARRSELAGHVFLFKTFVKI